MNSYYIENEIIYFKTAYDAEFISDVKMIVGRKYDPETKMWNCPINFSTSKQIEKLILTYKIEEKCLNERSYGSGVIDQFNLENAVHSLKHRLKTMVIDLPIPWKIREYQFDGIAYMLTTKRCINASAPGTGKTLMAILSVELENLFPCIVVVPASVKYNWQRQWHIINPNRKTSIIIDKKSDFSADVLILTYDSIGKKLTEKEEDKEDKVTISYKYDQLNTLSFKSLVCDESHAIKNKKAVRTKAIKKLSKGIDHIFMLTGTPVLNRPSEIISPLDVLRQFKSTFGDWKAFVYRYCDAHPTHFGLDYTGASNVIELHDKLKKSCYYRIEKRDVLKDLPPIQETLYQIDITNRKEYNRAKSDLIDYLKENYGQLKADQAFYAESLVLMNTLTQLSTEGKIEGICEWLDSFIESSEEKIVVFGVHVDPLKILAGYYDCDVIVGDVNPKKRQLIIDNFQINDKRILFMNIAVGSIGIDGLQNVCSNVLFMELPWHYSSIDQAISRVERSGQKNNIEVFYLLGKDTIDDDMWEIVCTKKYITDAVNSGVNVEATSYMQDFIKRMMKEGA